jgi:hypothetical protein
LFPDFSSSSAPLTAVFFQSKLAKILGTDALLDINLFVISTVRVTIKHSFEVCVVAFIAGSLIIYGVGEKSVETETDEKGLTDLNEV